MTEASPRTAIVGAGLMGRWHADAARRAGASVMAVVDPDETARSRVARRLGGAKGHPDLGAAFDAHSIDVVHVCTPRASHVALVREALDRGAHVLVEKPLAPTPSETGELLATAAACGLLLCPVHQFPFQRGVRRAVAWLEEMGPLLHLDMTICSAGAEGATEEDRDLILADIVPHPLSLVAALSGTGLDAIAWTATRARPSELAIHGALGRTTIHAVVSLAARPTQCSARLLTPSGTVHLDFFHGYAFREGGRTSRLRKVGRPFALSSHQFAVAAGNLVGRIGRREPAYPGLRELVHAFHAAVARGEASPIPPHEVMALAVAREAIWRAARGSSA